ncbi:MAG TPA: hypothetical protein VJC17_00965 [Candidatus Dojkabacteria bacterium]|nr:hypothetical protein [Candidatus Dojkabacteria bacterium]
MKLPQLFKENRLISLLAIVLLFLASNLSLFTVVYATPEDDLAVVQKKLQEIRNKKNGIQNNIKNEKNILDQLTAEINKLKNQIDLLNTQIEEKQLIIQELQLKIDILTNQITVTEAEITIAQNEITELQKETDKRLVDMYLDQKTFSQVNLIFSSAGTDFIKYDLYQNTIQEKTNALLAELKNKKVELNAKKVQLEDDKITVLKDETQLQEEKIAMEQDKADLDQQRQIYYRKKSESNSRIGYNKDQLENLTEEEQKVLAEQTKLEQIVFDRISKIPNGSYVAEGTIIGYEGCTGYCTGPHLHFAVKINNAYTNPCGVLPAGVLGNCGNGAGQMQWPLRGTFVLTSGYGWRWGKFHYAIDIAYTAGSGPIYAAHNGWMYRGFEPCSGPICNNGGANYVIICEDKNNCGNGRKTMYWHLK